MIPIQPITQPAFAPFGDLIDTSGSPDMLINEGLCERYHDRACIEAEGARPGLSLFCAQPRDLPYELTMMERHPLGSQAFIPMSQTNFLVTVAPDVGGAPGTPLAFRTDPGQAINLHKGTWHGVLTPLCPPGLFAVVDRIGDGTNLEEHWFDDPYLIG